MELEFELNEKDYVNYNMDYAKGSSTLRRSIMIQRLMGPVLFLVFPYFIKNRTNIPM